MLEELKAKYRQSLAGKIQQLNELLAGLESGEADSEKQIRLIAHSLYGSGSTYGFPQISSAARLAEFAESHALQEKTRTLISVLEQFTSLEFAKSTHPSVLIIEDDNDISDLLNTLIETGSGNYHVDIASTAEKAIALTGSQQYALIVLDLLLPDSDGRALLQQFRQTSAATPVFILSAVDDSRVEEECLHLGAEKFYRKPFDPQLVAESIIERLQQHGHEGFTEQASPAAASATLPDTTEDLPSESAGSILLVEDDELLVNIIRHRMNREGLEITHASNGPEALEALQQRSFGLVILDVKIPVMDGFEVLQNLRNSERNANTPVIMLTAMGSEKDVVRGYHLGANDYMLKPFSPVELIARAKSLL